VRLAPAWLRLLLPVAAAVAVPLGPRLPVAVRRQVQDWLRFAEIDEAVSPEQWIAVGALAGVAGAFAGLLVPVPAPGGAVLMACVGGLPWLWLRDAVQRRQWQVLRDLPMYVDMLTLALEAGGALSVALQVATGRSPDSPLRRGFMRLHLDLRAGRTRTDALRALDARIGLPSFTAFVAAVIQAEAGGGNLSAGLRAQAEQRLSERFARAEKLALEAPVKMLGPLILCIFPCTFIVLAFPVLSRFLNGG
jgi:tight adherence protein C